MTDPQTGYVDPPRCPCGEPVATEGALCRECIEQDEREEAAESAPSYCNDCGYLDCACDFIDGDDDL